MKPCVYASDPFKRIYFGHGPDIFTLNGLPQLDLETEQLTSSMTKETDA